MSNSFLAKYDGRWCLVEGDEVFFLAINTLDDLLMSVPASELMTRLRAAKREKYTPTTTAQAPIERQPVWAAGVTYKRSEEARELESNNSTIYTRVYDARRPELFSKAQGFEVVAPGDSVGIRFDATWSVPEPELTIMLNARMEVIGFTIGNDMSSRDIEGENPLYLPQAKAYEASCALGPRIWLIPGATDWPDASIRIEIRRDGVVAFSDETSTAAIHRPLLELVEYLGRCKPFARGVFLMSGTGIVPPDEFGLQAGDTVRITVDPIGELENPVKVVGRPVFDTSEN